MTGAGWGELHGPVHLTSSAPCRARHARTNKGGPVPGMAMIAVNAVGLALTGWISVGELAGAHAASAATVPDQPPAEEQPRGPYVPATANATAAPAPAARPVRGPHGRSCRCGTQASPTP